MTSLPGYFQHIKGKVYIDKYPAAIIDLNELMKGTLFEFGPGAGYDLLWLFQHGMPPERMFSAESDSEAYRIQSYVLHSQVGIWAFFHLPMDIRDLRFRDEMFDFIYANNTLHCLGDKKGINAVVTKACRLLRPGGVFFGRTLSDEIDAGRLAAIEKKLGEIQEFTLVEQPPVSCLEVYFSRLNPNGGEPLSAKLVISADSYAGQLLLEQSRPERTKRIPNPEYERLRFTRDTAIAVQQGRLVGIPPAELESMAALAGFAHACTLVREHTWKPIRDYYFRFEKQR